MIKVAVVDDLLISRIGMSCLITEWCFEVVMEVSSLWELYDRISETRNIPDIVLVNLYNSRLDTYAINKLKSLSIIPHYVIIDNHEHNDLDAINVHDRVLSKNIPGKNLRTVFIELSALN